MNFAFSEVSIETELHIAEICIASELSIRKVGLTAEYRIMKVNIAYERSSIEANRLQKDCFPDFHFTSNFGIRHYLDRDFDDYATVVISG
jgi:hypothetical protein